MATDKYSNSSFDQETQDRLAAVAAEQKRITGIELTSRPVIVKFLLSFYEKYGMNKELIGDNHETTHSSHNHQRSH